MILIHYQHCTCRRTNLYTKNTIINNIIMWRVTLLQSWMLIAANIDGKKLVIFCHKALKIELNRVCSVSAIVLMNVAMSSLVKISIINPVEDTGHCRSYYANLFFRQRYGLCAPPFDSSRFGGQQPVPELLLCRLCWLLRRPPWGYPSHRVGWRCEFDLVCLPWYFSFSRA